MALDNQIEYRKGGNVFYGFLYNNREDVCSIDVVALL